MKKVVIIFALLAGVAAAAEQYVYVKDGAVKCRPRDLPSVGVRQDTGQAVAGLHGTTDAVKAACGWYKVLPSLQQAGSNQVVQATSYTVGRYTVQAVHQYAERRTVTLAERTRALFDHPELQGKSADDKAAEVIKAVAEAVTNRLGTIQVIEPVRPVKPAEPMEPEKPVIGGRN